jgi:hypothetical protein
MSQELERYLNDHLAGSSGALLLIGHLIETAETAEARDFFGNLRDEVAADQKLLEQLLESAAMKTSATLKIAGEVTGRVGLLKLMWEGFQPGELGRFEALEMLAIGIQGKRLLWLALAEISPWFPEWREFNFAALELQAISQRDEVEKWRIKAAVEALPDVERRP